MEMEPLTQDCSGVGGDHMQWGRGEPLSQQPWGSSAGTQRGAGSCPAPALPADRQPRGDRVTVAWQGASISADLSTQEEGGLQ